MPETDIGASVASDLTTQVVDYSVDTQETDGAAAQKETTWENTKWSQYLGYYKTIPEIRITIDAKATWTIGKGFQAEEPVTLLLDTIKGWGKDTFNTILENAERVKEIGGNSYAEIIIDDEGTLLNLKPLDPGTMVHVFNKEGMLIRFEQKSKIKGKPNQKFKPEEIFYLARNRLADEAHGVSVIEACEKIILMRNEAMEDWRRVLHRNVDPLWIFHLDTDDTSQIAAFKASHDAARGAGENMYIPKGAVVPELVTTAGNASLNPLPWIDNLNNYFYEAVGVPKIIVGSSTDITEASAKISYLAFQQTIEEEQLYIEEQVLAQLGIEIKLEFPASLENELLSDKPKVEDAEVEQEQPLQENDTTAEVEGNK